MEVKTTAGGIRATDVTGAVTVATGAWQSSDGAGSPGPADEVVTGTVRSLSFVPSAVFVERLDAADARATDGGRVDVGGVSGPTRLPRGDYRLRVEGRVDVLVRFAGAAMVTAEHDAVAVRFPEPTAVSLGFRGSGDAPEVVTVPRTPAGVAAAVSTFGTGYRTRTAARSAPSMRGRPPRVEFGDAVAVPDPADPAPGGDVELVCPPELPYLFTVAPLASYLDATVRIGDGQPRLVLPDGEHVFDELPGFQREVNGLLRRSFLLDCLVREGPAGAESVAERDLLAEVGIDPDALAGAPIAERVARYLSVPFDRVSARLPQWHLSMYVAPTYETLPTLSHVVSDLSFVFLPEAQPLGGDERLARSLDDFYRGADGGSPPSAEVNAVKPVLGPGRIHGWLADGIPIDVFKSLPEAFENRDRHRPTDHPLSVVAVLNDTDMIEEYADLDDAYDREVGTVGVDVEVRKRLSRRELADVFESSHDLVHYIGHCETAGLRCTDGNLSARDVSESNAEAFLLNACGSYYEGVDLVRKGSVAGAVTFNKVLDRHAARVGTTFVGLLVHGFSIEQALDLARRRIIMGKDYAVVGDGTHALVDPADGPPAEATLRRVDDGRYRITLGVHDARSFGGTYARDPPFDARPRLVGSDREVVVDAAEAVRYLRTANVPVVYDGDIHWAGALAERLDADDHDGSGDPRSDPAAGERRE